MKKIYIIPSILFLTPFITFATSGACSSHGGVNCSAQVSRYDPVMCNDGWSNSSVYYYQADECQTSSCTAPSGSGCKTESDYSAKQVQLNAQGGYLGGSASQQGVLQQCRNEIDAYQSALRSYNSCLSGGSSSSSGSSGSSYSSGNSGSSFNSFAQNYCRELYGENANYNSAKDSCFCNKDFYLGEDNQCYSHLDLCIQEHGPEVHGEGLKCTCNTGFVMDFNQNELCVPIDDWCIENEGPNFYGKDGKCVLKEEVIIKPVEPKSVIAKPKIVTPEVKTTPKPTETEINEGIKIEPLIPAEPIQELVEVEPIKKPSIFKRTINWFISLFN